jgi:hypothetical protein
MTNRFSRDIDLYFTSAGDYFLDPDVNDLLDTRKIKLRCLIQRVMTRIRASKGDWRSQPQIGAQIAGFAGRPNTAETAEEIKSMLSNELMVDGFLKPNEVAIEIFPVSKRQIAIILQIRPMGQIEEVFLSFTYDARDNKLVARNF